MSGTTVSGQIGIGNKLNHMWYDPNLHLAVTYNYEQQTPYTHPKQACTVNPNGMCVDGSAGSAAPFFLPSQSQHQFFKAMYAPYEPQLMPTPTNVALQLVQDRSPSTTCVFRNLDSMML
jgi:hypothetical protein